MWKPLLRVFLDLKLYDVGKTVKCAVAQVAKVGVDFLTVHGNRRSCWPRWRARALRP